MAGQQPAAPLLSTWKVAGEPQIQMGSKRKGAKPGRVVREPALPQARKGPSNRRLDKPARV